MCALLLRTRVATCFLTHTTDRSSRSCVSRTLSRFRQSCLFAFGTVFRHDSNPSRRKLTVTGQREGGEGGKERTVRNRRYSDKTGRSDTRTNQRTNERTNERSTERVRSTGMFARFVTRNAAIGKLARTRNNRRWFSRITAGKLYAKCEKCIRS